MSSNKEAAVTLAEGDEPISKVSINKYDPFQLKGTVDDEMCFVSVFNTHIIALVYIVDREL